MSMRSLPIYPYQADELEADPSVGLKCHSGDKPIVKTLGVAQKAAGCEDWMKGQVAEDASGHIVPANILTK